jgi:excinuclease ABC subunit B
MSEELTAFLAENGIRVRYLHSEIETIERVEILHDLRAGVFDVLVGINLLREGLDLPEVALVAILDADKIGFLRSAPALIQTSGRAARNVHGHVVMYGDRVSDAMETAIGEMARRREKQLAWNAAQGITPRTIEKEIGEILYRRYAAVRDHAPDFKKLAGDYDLSVAEQRLDYESKLEERMHTAAENLEFEQAAAIRDELARLRGRGDGGAAGASGSAPRQGRKKR